MELRPLPPTPVCWHCNPLGRNLNKVSAETKFSFPLLQILQNFLWIAVQLSIDTVCGRELWGSKRTKVLAIRKESFNETAQPPLYCNLCKNFFIDGQGVQRLSIH